MPLVVPFVLAVSWNGSFGVRPWAITQHLVWEESDDRSVGDLETIAYAMGDAWTTGIADATSDNVNLDTVKITDLDSLSAHIVEVAIDQPGSRSSTCMPPNVAVLCTKVDSHTRTQRPGRWFFPGVCEVDTADSPASTLDGTGLATWSAAASTFFDGLSGSASGSDYYPVVLHKGPEGPDDFIPYRQTDQSVQGLLATQRRRLRG